MDTEYLESSRIRRPSQAAIEFEKTIIACAIGLIARGEVLPHSDIVRLWLAVERVQEFL